MNRETGERREKEQVKGELPGGNCCKIYNSSKQNRGCETDRIRQEKRAAETMSNLSTSSGAWSTGGFCFLGQ